MKCVMIKSFPKESFQKEYDWFTITKVQWRVFARWLLRGGLPFAGQCGRQDDTSLAPAIDESLEERQEVMKRARAGVRMRPKWTTVKPRYSAFQGTG